MNLYRKLAELVNVVNFSFHGLLFKNYCHTSYTVKLIGKQAHVILGPSVLGKHTVPKLLDSTPLGTKSQHTFFLDSYISQVLRIHLIHVGTNPHASYLYHK